MVDQPSARPIRYPSHIIALVSPTAIAPAAGPTLISLRRLNSRPSENISRMTPSSANVRTIPSSATSGIGVFGPMMKPANRYPKMTGWRRRWKISVVTPATQKTSARLRRNSWAASICGIYGPGRPRAQHFLRFTDRAGRSRHVQCIAGREPFPPCRQQHITGGAADCENRGSRPAAQVDLRECRTDCGRPVAQCDRNRLAEARQCVADPLEAAFALFILCLVRHLARQRHQDDLGARARMAAQVRDTAPERNRQHRKYQHQDERAAEQ